MAGKAPMAVALLAVLGSGAAPAGPTPLRRVEALTARDGVGPGETLQLVIRVSLNREFHVNSHVPSQEYLIPTSMEVEPQPGLFPGEWVYPKGEDRRFPFADEPLRIYEGTFLIRGSMRVEAGAPPGLRSVTARLRYQACTAEKCLPPARESIPVVVRVVPPGTVTHRLRPELFPSEKP